MDVHIQSREGAEQLGSAVLLAALDDLMVTEYSLEPGTDPGDPHYHADHSDAFYVLEGELEFRIEPGGRSGRAPERSSPRHAEPCTPSRSQSVHGRGS
jgi:quercetin dioxygenase-like cupin family protein